jgi:hypothetical protein
MGDLGSRSLSLVRVTIVSRKLGQFDRALPQINMVLIVKYHEGDLLFQVGKATEIEFLYPFGAIGTGKRGIF